jgi:hypothetical protein
VFSGRASTCGANDSGILRLHGRRGHQQTCRADPKRRKRTAARVIARSFFAVGAYVTVEAVRSLRGGAEPPL